MTVGTAMGWAHGLLRATLIGTVLQLTVVVTGHYEATVASLFAALGMFLSLVAGLLAGRWSGGLGRAGATASGLAAGAVCALIGILESYSLGDVPAGVVAFGTVSSGVTGAIGGFLGRVTRKP
jgi:hypothetical protein